LAENAQLREDNEKLREELEQLTVAWKQKVFLMPKNGIFVTN
jgi:hypothetical protein